VAKLSEHQSGEVKKVLMLGDSGAGKTGSLLALIKAGWRISILDFDNGLDWLVAAVKRHCPDKLDNVDFVTLRDKKKGSVAGPIPAGIPAAFTKANSLLSKWEDGTAPETWGPKRILVIDSLTFMSNSAFAWKDMMNPGAKDRRQIYGAAQEAIEDTIDLLTSKEFNTNLLVLTHITWITRPDGSMRGYPSAVGTALSKDLATYFNTVLLAESTGSGDNLKRTIRTVNSALIDLKNADLDMPEALPLDTGLLKIFKQPA